MVRTTVALPLAFASLAFSLVLFSFLPACSKSPDALVQLDVQGDRSFTSVNLVLTANRSTSKTFLGVSFDQTTPFRVGMYLPSTVTGAVAIVAQATGSTCGIGSVGVAGVASGGIAPPVTLLIFAVDCGTLPGTGGASGGVGGAGGGVAGGSGGDAAGTGGAIGAGTGGTIGAGTGGTIGAGTGGTIGAGTGGTIGAGTGGAAAGTGGTSGCGALVDDMEANNGKICEGNGRAGHWFTYIDSYSGSSITPSPSQVPALPYEITTARAGSRYAMRAFGTYSSYAGIAALVNNAVIGQAPRTFDATAYTGVRFTAMGSGGIALVVQTSATESTTYGGTCTLASCYGAKYYVASGLSPSAWNTFSVPFTSLSAGNAAFRPSDVWSIEFQPTLGGSYDIWIDDVTFY